jgi:serine/threonine protein kinase
LQFGHTPFKGKTKQNTFDKILGQSVKFPDSPAVSKECKDLIKRLLNSDPKKRLGSESGAADVKEHKVLRPRAAVRCLVCAC